MDTWNRNIIYHYCCCKEDIAPQRTLKMSQRIHVIENYEGLTAEENSIVPDGSYYNAKAYFAVTKYDSDTTKRKKETDLEENGRQPNVSKKIVEQL